MNKDKVIEGINAAVHAVQQIAMASPSSSKNHRRTYLLAEDARTKLLEAKEIIQKL